MKRVPLMIVVVGLLASYAFAPRTSVLALQDSTYGDCGFPTGSHDQKDLKAVCEIYHKNAPGLVGTAYCLGEDCFNEHNGRYFSILPDGKRGDFPEAWTAWVKKGVLFKPSAGDICDLPGKKSGKGVRIELSSANANPKRCKTDRVVGEHLYHEHFASNSVTKCLAWLECREDRLP